MQKRNSNLRIIGGKWRSRKINFIQKGVRPTTDMARETLFNWLAPHILDANCLDLFSGSGSLGFEALSRGAKHVVMVDASAKCVGKLQENSELLQTDDAELICTKLPTGIARIPEQFFDIVFIDPPFYKNLLGPTCKELSLSNLLAPNAIIYAEAEKTVDIEEVKPKSWKILRKKIAGSVGNYLMQPTD